MLVTLPFVLLLLDCWPLGRAGPGRAARSGRPRPARWRKPRCSCSPPPRASSPIAASRRGVIKTVEADRSGPASPTPPSPTPPTSASRSGPRTSRCSTPIPAPGSRLAGRGGALLALARSRPSVVLRRAARRTCATGWLWYLGTLLPVIGIVQVGGQARADRYTYLPLLGVSLALVWLAAVRWPRTAAARRAAGGACRRGARARAPAAQVGLWKDDSQPVHPGDAGDHGQLPAAQQPRHRPLRPGPVCRGGGRALTAFVINPEHCNAHYNLGLRYAQREAGQAVLHLRGPGQNLESLPPSERASTAT